MKVLANLFQVRGKGKGELGPNPYQRKKKTAAGGNENYKNQEKKKQS